jgi:single-strand DNA-binding protein
MINNVVLVGRLVKDIDLKYTGSGTAVGTFTMAVQRNFTDQNGKRESDFINCVIWRKSAENMANFTRKGSLVGIEGRIQTRNYENQQGQRVYITEVVVENFTLLESKQATEQRPRENTYQSQDEPKQTTQQNNGPRDASKTGDYKYNTFDSFNNAPDPFLSNGESINIHDDDLPF